MSARIVLQPLTDLAFSIISFHEQVLGCQTYLARARNAADVVRGYRMLERVLDAFATAQVLPFDVTAAGKLDTLLVQRTRVGTMDLRIAAISLRHNLVLLTRNSRDFSRVPGLVIQDWTI